MKTFQEFMESFSWHRDAKTGEWNRYEVKMDPVSKTNHVEKPKVFSPNAVPKSATKNLDEANFKNYEDAHDHLTRRGFYPDDVEKNHFFHRNTGKHLVVKKNKVGGQYGVYKGKDA